ncbi:MAG: hypothetical protein JWO53_738 [Chlamydiia bacterium]|nr:hypothetical protein [Chlamydiia bacterium]
MTTVNYATFHSKADALIEPTLRCFQKISKKYFLFHLAFALLVSLEILLIGFFFSPLIDSFFMGIAIALLFFTALLYFILRLYYTEQKPEELLQLRDEYLAACKEYLPHGIQRSDEHLAIANSACRMAESLKNTEQYFYKLPQNLSFLSPTFQKCSLQFHSNDVEKMKELFLLASIKEHISLIKCEPTSLDAHAATANAYVMLSSHYSVKKRERKRKLADLEQKHRYILERALEEFKILNDYAPDDPWVHEQLALSYQALKMVKQEIQEYESLLKLKPDDYTALCKLGSLYFQEGENARGLKIYEQLLTLQPDKAAELIQHYGVGVLN